MNETCLTSRIEIMEKIQNKKLTFVENAQLCVLVKL